MNKLVRWRGIVHKILLNSYPEIKLSQTLEILSAAFGHKSYASFRIHDLGQLDKKVKYILIDKKLAIDRAVALGITLTEEQWWDVEKSLKPSGVSGGIWLTDEEGMSRAARIIFEDESHQHMDAIAAAIGVKDRQAAKSAHCLSAKGFLAEELKFIVRGDVCAFSIDTARAVPVTAEVVFKKIGRQFYAQGKLLQVEQCGTPQAYEPEFESDFYLMSED